MSRMSERVRKVFAVLLLLLLLGNIYLLVIFPLQNYYNKHSDQITSLRNDYKEYYQISLSREELETEAKRISDMRESQGYFLKSDSSSLAAAELQAHVKKIIENSGGRLLSTQPIPTADSNKLQTVHVRVRMQGDMTVLHKMLHGLEAGKPTVILDNVVLSHVNISKRYTKKMTQAAISVNFDIIGFIQAS